MDTMQLYFTEKQHNYSISFNAKLYWDYYELHVIRELLRKFYLTNEQFKAEMTYDYDLICIVRPIHHEYNDTWHFNFHLANKNLQGRSGTMHAYVNMEAFEIARITKVGRAY